jgi:hypothetical protein
MIETKKAIANPKLSENIADQNWLESDLSRLDEYEPYDWGDLDPLTLGKPIKYVPDRGFVVEGGKENV